ncbi:MAG: polymer-forming cytoskeletal protein [Deltaproteobacteria bacterium]|nr:polymer-forming cytoskeletal protein [Deltaproteobacteria bacterium]
MKKKENSDVTTLIGEGTTLKGELSFEGVVRIDGIFSGKIVAPKAVLIIGPKGRVDGEIKLLELNLLGSFNGKIDISGLCRMISGCNFSGELKTGSISVEDGSVFNGTCQMVSDEKKPNTKSK